MEHSKLPLKVGAFTAFQYTITDSEESVICKFVHQGVSPSKDVSRERAAFIVEACNAHAELKAKAGLLDELAVAYRIKYAINDNPLSLMELVDKFALEAKELK